MLRRGSGGTWLLWGPLPSGPLAATHPPLLPENTARRRGHRDWCRLWPPGGLARGTPSRSMVQGTPSRSVQGKGDRGGRGLGRRAGAGRPREAPRCRPWTDCRPHCPWTCRGLEGLGSHLPPFGARVAGCRGGGAVEPSTPGRPLPVEGTAAAGGPGANAGLSGCSGADPLPQAEAQEPRLEGASPRGAGAVSAAGPAHRGWGLQGTFGGGPTPGGGR